MYLQHESDLLNDFFERIRSPELTNDNLHEAVMFLKELCSFARTLEMSPSSTFSESTFFKVRALHSCCSFTECFPAEAARHGFAVGDGALLGGRAL